MKKIGFLLLIILIVGCTASPIADREIGPDEVMYFILTDRFRDGDQSNNYDVDKSDLKRYHGGDFQGIRDQLDYLEDLGITMVWITPVQQNTANGYHGYWIDDFYAIEPHLGTLEDLKGLTEEMHRRGMKLIVDFVINHTGYDSQILEDNPDWFHPDRSIHNWSDKQQVEQGWLAGLPDFDQTNPEVADYLINSALWLIEETGIDGFRLDTVRHVDLDFWNTFVDRIRQDYPAFYFIGEVYNYNPPVLNHYKQSGIDGMLNYPMYQAILTAFRDNGSMTAIETVMNRSQNDPSPERNGMFVDNHDNKRFLSQVGDGGLDYLKQAITFIMTTRQIPVIYYGTEVGMEGWDDPDNRRGFPWDDTENRLEPLWSKLLELRSDNIYKQGSVVILDVSKEYLLYQIESDEGRFVIGMNNLTEPVHLNREPGELTNFLDPEAAVDFVIPARGIIIYRSK